MSQNLTAFVTFHAEPNELYLKPGDTSPWTGFDEGFATVERLRNEVIIKEEMKFVWLFRADPQIEFIYGDVSWGLKRYAKEIEQLMKRGDEVGIHVHPYKWLEDQKRWIQDFSDEDWICHCVSQAFHSFQDQFQRKPESMSIGPNSTYTQVANHCRDLGIKYDFTLANNGKKAFNQARGEIKGEINWVQKLPSSFYSPSRADVTQQAAEPDHYHVIPVQYFKRKVGVMNYKGMLSELSPEKANKLKIKPSLAMPQNVFKEVLAQCRK
ncbi:MAG: hypothetical protein AAFQ98_22270, partial [Bacteroidota bacterium]